METQKSRRTWTDTLQTLRDHSKTVKYHRWRKEDSSEGLRSKTQGPVHAEEDVEQGETFSVDGSSNLDSRFGSRYGGFSEN